jgi:hypothetical protein
MNYVIVKLADNVNNHVMEVIGPFETSISAMRYGDYRYGRDGFDKTWFVDSVTAPEEAR